MALPVWVTQTLLPSERGMEMMTPFPVPTHSRLQDTMRAVILTKEKPSRPVPENDIVWLNYNSYRSTANCFLIAS